MKATTIIIPKILFVLILLVKFPSFGNSACSGGRRKDTSGPKAFLCYWGTWSYYKAEAGNIENTDAKFDVVNIDPNLCTHLLYSFAGLDNKTNLIRSLDPWLDYPQGECEVSEVGGPDPCGEYAALQKTTRLREINPNLKILVAIGGWGQGSLRFSDMAKSPEERAKFIASVVQFLIKHDLDGLDFDWEYPGGRDGDPNEDKANFVTLLKELRFAFDALEDQNNNIRDYWLTAALGVGPETVEKGYDVPGISKSLDCLNLMAYDLKVYSKDTWELIGHHSPLYPKEDEDFGNQSLSVSRTVENFIALGAPPEKLALGVGAYGKTYDITGLTGSGQKPGFYDLASGPGKAFGFSQENGTVALYEICYYLVQKEALDGWNFGFDYDYSVPLAYNGSIWIGYDNEDSTVAKVDYAEEMGLGGMMIWSIDQDDFSNWCKGWTANPIGSTIKNRMEYHAQIRASATI